MDQLRNKKGFICDMDGVIYHGNQILPGVKEFIDWLYREDKKFLFLTNNSGKTPQELQEKLSRMGLHVDTDTQRKGFCDWRTWFVQRFI